jgi:ankyrin repeat protein
MSIFFPVDDIDMMSKKVSFGLFLCALCLFFLIISGCVSNRDVWTLIDRGETEQARELFLGETDIRAVDSRGRTPLHAAAEAQNVELTDFFISMGADVHALDNQNRTPLNIGTEKRNIAITRILTQAGSDIHYAGPEGMSPALTGILEEGGFLEALLTPSSIEAADPDGRTILHLAAAEGKTGAVKSIVSRGNSLALKDNQGKTALDLALEQTGSLAHAETAEQLILAGACSENPIFPYFSSAVRSSNYDIRDSDGITPLHFAAREGYAGIAGLLLARKAGTDIKSASGTTPLHEAARAGNISIMEMLLAGGAEVNAQDAKGNSVLHTAIPPEVNQEALYLLLFYGANPNLKDEHGDSPLHIAITLNRDPEIITTLLEAGADVSIHNIDGKTPLYVAVEENRVSHIPLLLAYHSDVFAVDNTGITPLENAIQIPGLLSSLITEETVLQSDSGGNRVLHFALKNRLDANTIEYILDRNASINARNKEGDTGLHLAVRQDDREAGELLLSRGADIFAPNTKGEDPLFLAFNRIEGMREWMINPYTLEARDGIGNSILHYAARWRIDSGIPVIIRGGVNPETVNAGGETPLFMAAKADSPSTIEILTASGASCSGRDFLGNTPLHTAVRWDAQGAAEKLITSGADINAQALNGRTPLHDAVRLGISRLEIILTEHGANPDLRDAEGNTSLMEAVMTGSPAATERLGKSGADPAIRNIRGDTPLHAAVAAERSDLAGLLLALGASIHAKNAQGRTPLQTALASSPRMVSALLTNERILSSDDNGASPLHIAVSEKAPLGVIQIIMDQGGQLSAVDAEGRTPLRLAVNQRGWAAARLLADAGADVFSFAGDGKNPAELALLYGRDGIDALFSGRAVKARDSSGNTILHYGAKTGSTETISRLIELGADKSARNIAGESPADLARRWNRADLIPLLQN